MPGISAVAENNTALSVTCRRAFGIVVSIPTFCAWAKKVARPVNAGIINSFPFYLVCDHFANIGSVVC